jgi:radical SAM superfamily enzyme YgiQ (UPF0313 family)
VRVLVVSTYELGHQPLQAGSAATALRAAGHDVRVVDVAVDALEPADVGWADAVALSVPMHTAMRLALDVAADVRAARPRLPVALFGLYATVASDDVVGRLADAAIAGEHETDLVRWVEGATVGVAVALGRGGPRPPARDLLPPLDRYARLAWRGEERLAGYVEASRGCSHRCRHCPVPVVYDGRVRLADVDAVVDDVARLVAAGARHLTFGDPDFLNAPQHARRVVQQVHERFPDLTWDCTTKVEHVLRHADLWPVFAASGCLFVISAFESVDDDVLRRLDKGHTAAEAAAATALLRRHGIEVRPSWLPFTPWTTPAGVVDLLDFVVAQGLVANVDPVQYTIRLLLPDGSLLLDDPDLAPHLGPYDPAALSWTWQAADPRADTLQRELATLVEDAAGAGAPDHETFAAVDAAARRAAGIGPRTDVVRPSPRDVPRLTEAWFCCAEPTGAQRARAGGDSGPS